MAPHGRQGSRAEALRTRDRGLRRVSIATRSLVAVSVGATGFFTALAARAQTGHAKAVRTNQGAASSVLPKQNPKRSTAPRYRNRSDDVPQYLAPPPTQPAAGYQYDPAPVVSGAT